MLPRFSSSQQVVHDLRLCWVPTYVYNFLLNSPGWTAHIYTWFLLVG
jgi:hypothetical protein